MSKVKYGWIITRDMFTGGDDMGVTGPQWIATDIKLRLEAGEGRNFRLKDDDGNVCYYGRYIGPDTEELFGPLDDFGEPNAGCTMIEYLVEATHDWEII
jgi:hypothetical protein